MLIWDPSDQLVSGSVIRDSESGTGQSGGPTMTGPVEDLGERNRHKTNGHVCFIVLKTPKTKYQGL